MGKLAGDKSMGLPVGSLSDQELSHYAAFDEKAAQELVRRNTRYSVGYIAQIEALERELEWSESQREELEDEVANHDSLWNKMECAAELIRKAISAGDNPESQVYLEQALEELEELD